MQQFNVLPMRISPVQLCGWFLAIVFMVTAPLGCGGCASGDGSAQAQSTGQSSGRPGLEEVADELICDYPSCSKESLHECTTCEYAKKYRKEISTMLDEGKTKQEILDHFADTYGEHLLGNPRTPVATVVPFAVVLLGLIPLAIMARSAYHQRKQKSQRPVENKRAKAPAKASTSQKHEPGEIEDPRVAAALRDFDY